MSVGSTDVSRTGMDSRAVQIKPVTNALPVKEQVSKVMENARPVTLDNVLVDRHSNVAIADIIRQN